MERSGLIERLSAMRATIRRRLVAYGVCLVLAGGTTTFLAAVALDWLLWLPSLLRLGVSGVGLVVLIVAVLRWIVRPAQAQVGLGEIAARIEAYFGRFQDRLTSAVDFLMRRDAGSPSMMRQVIYQTEQRIRDIPLESSLTVRPLVLRVAFLSVSLVVLAIVMVASPEWARTGLYRYIYPWGRIEWPRGTSIVPLTDDVTAAVGESVTVRMAVERGFRDDLRGTVSLREADGGTMALAMQHDRDREHQFYATIDVVTKDLTYWFEAGDDSTSETPYTIRVVRRPEVVESLATVEPPPYASAMPVRVRDLADGPVPAPIGGHVRVAVRASKPIPPDPTGTAVGLRTQDDRLIPLAPDADDPERLFAQFEVREDVHFRIELRDAEGFENRSQATYSVPAVPDTPPNVVIVEPRSAAELTPQGALPLVIRAEDDFGVTSMTLAAERIGGGAYAIPLTDRMETAQGEAGVEAVVRHLWSVEAMSLSPGDLIVYRAEAADNHAAPDGGVQTGQSAPMRIRIISDVEFDIRLRSDLARLEARLRQTALDQTDLLDRTTALVSAGDDAEPLTDAQREAAAASATRQMQLAGRLHDLSDRFREMTERMQRNRTGDQAARERIASLGDAMKDIASDPMTAARGSLEQAREHTGAAAQQEALREAVRQERNAVDRLQALIGRMAEWGSFHELATRTRDLLDRQDAVRRDTAQLGQSTLGRPVASLTESEAAGLKRVQRRQEQLATDIERLLAGMAQLVEAAKPQDQAAAGAVDAALRAARAHDAAKHMDTAAEAIEANRTAAATISQKSASDAIREMIAALREQDRDQAAQLEELRKQLDRAEDQIKALIEEQEAVRQATRETVLMGAGDRTGDAMAGRQRTLSRNTALLGDELAGSEQTLPAASPVHKAAVPMERAALHLTDGQPEPATGEQDAAMTWLHDALARLEELARETEREAMLRSLDQIREALEEILKGQRAVNAGIGELRQAVEARGGRLGRGEARSASKLARQQADVRTMVESQVPDFQKVIVYEWALARVSAWMDDSRARLTDRRIDDDLIATTDRIVRELEKLVGAIVQTKALPVDTEFVESDRGGGGGQGGMMQYKPVPTVAELLVLKAMQLDINVRTGRLHGSLDIDRAAESELRELRMLGEDQTEVRLLTEKLTERAQMP